MSSHSTERSTPAPVSLDRETGLLDQLKQKFPDIIKDAHIIRRSRPEITVTPDRIIEVAKYLRDELGFERAEAVSGIDYLRDQRMEVVYHVSNVTRKETRDIVLAMRESVPRINPKVKSLVEVWPSADNYERETFEMYGITFDGHPHLEKLFLNDNWDGPPPLRKDVRIPTD